jgi:two-component system NtrC family sensor kinase
MSHAPRPRILVIDDEPLIGSLITRVLGSGYEVVAVVHGRTGLDLLAVKDDFDLILCDLMMPDLTGMDVHAELLSRQSPHAQTMVFLTGGAFAGHAGQFLARVPNLCLEKPFLGAELRAAVRDALATVR